MEQRATDLGRVFAKLKRENPDIHVLSHQWLYDCKDKKRRLDVDGYEITRQPLPPAKKGTRTAFTPEDDMKLVKFIARNSKPKGRLGHSLYEDVERALPNHTASSWRQRYKTNQARLDQQIARYEAMVQQRRNNHEDPYTDSEHETASFTVTSGRGAWPSKSQVTQKRPALQLQPALQQSQSASTSIPPPSQTSGFKRLAIKGQRVPVEPSQTVQQEERRFRLDLNGPGERITFSDDEEESDVVYVPPKRRDAQAREAEDMPSQFTQDSITESVREELEQRGFPPLALKRKRAPAKTEGGGDEECFPTRKIRTAQQAFLDVPSSPPGTSAAVKATQADGSGRNKPTRLTSRPLPSILTDDNWNPLHLNTLLSAEQMADLIFVCSEDTSLATQIARLLYQSQVEGWNAARQQQAADMRRMMWSPEEDAALAEGALTSKMLQRHGEAAVKARVAYLQEKYEEMDDEERSRRRFPYDESLSA